MFTGGIDEIVWARCWHVASVAAMKCRMWRDCVALACVGAHRPACWQSPRTSGRLRRSSHSFRFCMDHFARRSNRLSAHVVPVHLASDAHGVQVFATLARHGHTS